MYHSRAGFLSLALALVVVAVSIAIGLTGDDWSWFQRSGAILAVQNVWSTGRNRVHILVFGVFGTLIWGYGDLLGAI